MTRIEHLLNQVMEEACEVAGRASKCKRFGVHEVQPGQEFDNLERLAQEIDDFEASLLLLRYELDMRSTSAVAINRKIEKVEKFMLYSKECGTLQ